MPSPGSRLRSLIGALPGSRALWQRLRSRVDPHERGVRAAHVQSPGLMLQDSGLTEAARYPWLFSFLADRLGTLDAPQIMSFGCSTGEEVFSLADHLPKARLLGIDINPHSIKVANRRLAEHPERSRIRFTCAGSPAGEGDERYDAILCLAVLRHSALQTTAPERCDGVIDFADIDRLVSDLARCLKPGGYLAIWHSQFRFADMSVAPQFDAMLSHARAYREHRRLYGPDNRRLDGVLYSEVVFRKR